jgi:hypothetical protein
LSLVKVERDRRARFERARRSRSTQQRQNMVRLPVLAQIQLLKFSALFYKPAMHEYS